jgi:tetratricopeptide (TPR) repeat protein
MVSLLFTSCGGDENPASANSDPTDPQNGGTEKPDPVEELPEPEPEPVVIPDPNGIYLADQNMTHEKKPVYSNGEGFFMWYNGSIWKISDKVGGGRTISTGKSDINDKWDSEGKASHYPSKASQKEAHFSLAVACQGSSDNHNAIRLFEMYIAKHKGDARLPEAYLSLGDLTISVLKKDEQPTYEQITKARTNYALVRESGPVSLRLINDATFNEGGLLERIANNPEGIVGEILPTDVSEYDENLHYPKGSLVFDGGGTKKFYLAHALALKGVQLSDKSCWEEVSFPDKDNDGLLTKTEFSNAPALKDLGASFAGADFNDDDKVDFDETVEIVSQLLYADMESLFREYSEEQSEKEGAQISQATEKIGFACEKLGRPSEMLEMYFKDIEKYGNDPMNVGVDGILKKYSAKFKEYDDLYGQTLDLLEKLDTPDQHVSFDYTSRKGVQETISGTVKEILKDRRKLLPYLSSNFKGMDSEIYTEVSKFRTAIFVNAEYASKFKAYLKKYKKLRANFPSALSPKVAFQELFNRAKSSGQRALELRMRAVLDKMGEKVEGSYTPQTSHFPDASPAVLVWMAEKFMATSSEEDAVATMERLINVFGDTGGEFLFDAHYVIGQAEDTYKNYAKAADHYNQALINSSWHENANDARIRQGDALYKVGLATKSQSAFELAYSSFEAVRGDTEAKLELRARCSFRMGECKIKVKDHRGAGFLFLETTLNFPSAVEWVPKAFEQAITCYQQTNQTDQITLVNAQYVAWQRKFLK